MEPVPACWPGQIPSAIRGRHTVARPDGRGECEEVQRGDFGEIRDNQLLGLQVFFLEFGFRVVMPVDDIVRNEDVANSASSISFTTFRSLILRSLRGSL